MTSDATARLPNGPADRGHRHDPGRGDARTTRTPSSSPTRSSGRMPTRTELDRGEASPEADCAVGDADSLDGLDLDELREGETDDPGRGDRGRPDLRAADRIRRLRRSAIPTASRSRPARPLGRTSRTTTTTSATCRTTELTAGSGKRCAPTPRRRSSRIASSSAPADRRPSSAGSSTSIDDSDAIVEVVERVDGVDEVVDETELARADVSRSTVARSARAAVERRSVRRRPAR